MTQTTTTMDRKATASPPSNKNPDIVEVAPNLPAGLRKACGTTGTPSCNRKSCRLESRLGSWR